MEFLVDFDVRVPEGTPKADPRRRRAGSRLGSSMRRPAFAPRREHRPTERATSFARKAGACI